MCNRSPDVLQFMCVYCVECPGFEVSKKVSTLSFWTTERLKKRQIYEIKNGGFGMEKVVDIHVDLEYSKGYSNEGDKMKFEDGCVDEIMVENVDARNSSVSFVY
jgi:hypothetical protein